MAKSNSKQYRNVYTILEKVKKGEIDSSSSYYGSRYGQGGLFSKMNFFKKEDLIKPHMHWLDENKLQNIVDSAVEDQAVIKQEYARWAKHSSFAKAKSKPNDAEFIKEVNDVYKKIPKHLIRDIHKLYYYRTEKLDFEDRTDKNNMRFKFLEKANNPVGKIMSENSNLKSSVFTKNMMLYYLMQMVKMKYIDEDQFNDMMNNMSGGGDGGQGDQQLMDKLSSAGGGDKSLEDLMKKAMDTCKELDNVMDGEMQEEVFTNSSNSKNDDSMDVGKMSPEYLKTIAGNLAKIKMSMTSLKEKIKNLLDKSASTFSAKEKVEYEDLFNASDISGLDEYHFLHPMLRKFMVEDVQIKNVKYSGKIDVYVDISGSMDGYSGCKTPAGAHISCLDFAKAMLAKMKEMDMLNDVYLFNSRLKKWRNDVLSISMITTSGGTDIDVAVRNVGKTGQNSLIITDAEDCCEIYDDRAFFIGVQGASFNMFSPDVIKEYSDKGQVVIFDGNKIFRVNETGQVVK